MQGDTIMLAKILLGAVLLSVAPFTTAAFAADQMSQSAEPAIAQMPSEHLAEAARYDAEAQNLESQATRHRLLANRYAASKGGGKAVSAYPGMVTHCRRLAASYERAAQDARTLAKAHRDMAK
jgi:hypothetical protein